MPQGTQGAYAPDPDGDSSSAPPTAIGATSKRSLVAVAVVRTMAPLVDLVQVEDTHLTPAKARLRREAKTLVVGCAVLIGLKELRHGALLAPLKKLGTRAAKLHLTAALEPVHGAQGARPIRVD
eukprot:CAMPEP_0197884846 /NCGR_PEP_ID=MMETSP1439-20131203/11156_1 /TAXON_ID=66791 /ORGANISM="Gonyaulax spinifera, Strain CCMP409" /LENGTH=123 /DNA_ID=CAMNT_0043504589 /DNA_START=219 /DNA_END=589 /DNA_ORIENTATION=+